MQAGGQGGGHAGTARDWWATLAERYGPHSLPASRSRRVPLCALCLQEKRHVEGTFTQRLCSTHFAAFALWNAQRDAAPAEAPADVGAVGHGSAGALAILMAVILGFAIGVAVGVCW